MTIDAAILNTRGIKSYWKLDETSGAIAADQMGASNGGYPGATLAQAGHMYGETNGGNAVLTGGGGYVGLGQCGNMVSDCISSNPDGGMTFGFFFKDAGIASGAGPFYVCGGYQISTVRAGWDLSINNGAFGAEGFTLRFVDNAGNVCSRQYKRPVGQSPLCDGYWHFIVVRIRIPSGSNTSTGTFSVTVDGIPYLLSAAWGDVAANVVIGASTDFDAGTQMALGARYVQTGGASTTIPALFQRAFRCNTILTDAEILDIYRAATFDPGWGAPDPEFYFDFRDATKMFRDAAGTLPVTTPGQFVERVNATFGTVYLIAQTGNAPYWNGKDLSFPNFAASASPRAGFQIMNIDGSVHPKQFRSSMVAVAGVTGAYVANTSWHTFLERTAASAKFRAIGASDMPAVNHGAATRVPAVLESMGVLKFCTTPGLIACSTGSNGSGNENDGGDYCFVQDDQVQGNGAGNGTATGGAYWEDITSLGWIGCVDAPAAGSYAGAFSGRMQALASYPRPLHPTTEAPYLRARAESLFPVLSRTDKVWVLLSGNSITSNVNDPTLLGGYMARLDPSFAENTVIVNAAIGGWYTNQQTSRLNSAKWLADKPAGSKSMVITATGTNDIINSGGGSQCNEATLEARIAAHISTIRAVFGATIPIIILVPKTGFSNAVAPLPGASTALMLAYLQASPSLYSALVEMGAYNAPDGTHPHALGMQQIADKLRPAVAQVMPQVFSFSGRLFRDGRTRRGNRPTD